MSFPHLFSGIRNNSTQSLYEIDASILSTNTVASTGVPTLSMFALCYNNNGTPNNYSGQTQGILIVGGGGINQTTLLADIQTFLSKPLGW
jgi:hypothetical protein